MCLVVSSNRLRPKVAKEDLVCYKILEVFGDVDLRTPFRYASVHLGEQMVSELDENPIVKEVRYGIHTLCDKEEAIELLKTYRDTFKHRFLLVRCVIPKGARFYKGKYLSTYFRVAGGELGSYCSDRIVYDNQVIDA